VRDVLTGVFRDAGMEAVFRTTDRVGHAADLAAEAAAVGHAGSPVAAVVSVGGDGTLHEVVNGLLRGRARKPATPRSPTAGKVGGSASAHSLPPSPGAARATASEPFPLVGVIPTGSGNAIAASLGLNTVLGAALNIVHGLRTRSARPVTLMQYGRLSPRRLSDSAIDAQRESISICGLQWGLLANVDLGTESLRWMGETRYDVGALRAIAANRVQYARVRLRVHRTLQHDVDKRLERSGGGNRGRGLESGGDQDLIIDGRFVTIVAWGCKYQSRTCAITPYAVPEEPCFDVVLCREGAIGRLGMLRSMLMLSQGNDAFLRASDGFEYYKCKQIRFEALDGEHLSVDGESVPVQPCYLSIAPETGKIRVLDVTYNSSSS
jgi:diacylglycerol kinase family enzyme